jgi:hypothetical protein
VFLVGDAAHRTTPRGATGMNTGIADGHNLGWKLAWVTRGWAAESLLDSYEPERAPVGRANAEASLRTGGCRRRPCDDPGLRGPLRLRSGGDWTRPGGPTGATPWVRAAGRTVSTLDLFGDRLTVFAPRHVEPGPSTAPMTVLVPDRDFTDPNGEFTKTYALGPEEAVLVRPDGYVAWAGPTAQLDQTVAALTGSPAVVNA